jgi:hypothetical protein
MMLAPENLVVKEIGGQKVKAKELLQYFKSYLEIYRGDELPEPKSMLVVSMFLFCFNPLLPNVACRGRPLNVARSQTSPIGVANSVSNLEAFFSPLSQVLRKIYTG